MHPDYLLRLGEPVQTFVREIEQSAGIVVDVVPDPQLNGGGPFGQGQLEVIIEAQRNLLRAPTNGYFPDGAVRHELLHLQRFHLKRVPKLVLAETETWDRAFSDGLTDLDNAIEHVLIVPEELRLHPERRDHWEAVMASACHGLPDAPPEERSLAVCMHWTFLRLALPGSPSADVLSRFAKEHGLLERADRFAEQFNAVAASKEEIVRLLFVNFPEILTKRVALEYISSVTGTRQTPLTQLICPQERGA